MGVRAFGFEPESTDAFVRLGYEIYRGDRAFVPPLERELRRWLAPSFPFYGRPGHRHRRFLAVANGRAVARALATVHPGLRARDGTPVGAIGLFESTPDAAAANDVLAAAVAWLRDQGLTRVWGPLQFDIWHGYRLMTRGFEREPFSGEPYNKPYYPELWESAGFRPCQTWNSFELPGRETLAQLSLPGAEAFRALLARGYRFEPFDQEPFETALDGLHAALVASFSGFVGFTPIGRDEFGALFGPARRALEPRCSTLVRDEAGRVAAFAVAFADLAPAVRAMRGRTSPWAWLRFFDERRRARRLMLHLGGVTPFEAARRSGVARALFHHTLRNAAGCGYPAVLATLIAAGSPMRRHYGACAEDRRREYALLEWRA
ncbi:MAG: hypothetical protein NDJ94_08955 [Vicinamibacteria bacterium]|nr:hypothetical protein [Vicinamibacteria bacterium]